VHDERPPVSTALLARTGSMQWLRACVRRCGRAASAGRWQVDGAGMGGEVRPRARGRAAHRGEGQRRGEGHRRVRPWGRRVCRQW
jgi:hypothetical protein